MSSGVVAPRRSPRSTSPSAAAGTRAGCRRSWRASICPRARSRSPRSRSIAIGWASDWGRCGLRRLRHGPARGRRRAGDARDPRCVPRRRAHVACATATDLRPWVSPRLPLRGGERDRCRTARDGAHARVRPRGRTRRCRGSCCRGWGCSRVGGDRRDRRGDGRVQLVRPPREPPRPDAVALPRAPPLAGGHERADGVPHPSADPRLVSRRR